MIKYFSMFSGIGGFEYGMQKAYKRWSIKNQKQSQRISSGDKKGQCSKLSYQLDKGFHCIGYSEIEPNTIKVYETHYSEHKNYGDCTKIKWQKVPKFNLLLAGFPCQAFSQAGTRLGFKDTRGTLFFEICRCLKEKCPEYFLLENVKGLLSHGSGRTFKTILTSLAKLGYNIEWQVLNSKNFRVPQSRNRVFFIGYLRKESFKPVFPIERIYQTHSKIIEYGHGFHRYRVYHERGLCATLSSFQNAGYATVKILQSPKIIRYLTPIEYERLQGFPDSWTSILKDKNRYECLGNAVTTNVVEEIIYTMFQKGILKC